MAWMLYDAIGLKVQAATISLVLKRPIFGNDAIEGVLAFNMTSVAQFKVGHYGIRGPAVPEHE